MNRSIRRLAGLSGSALVALLVGSPQAVAVTVTPLHPLVCHYHPDVPFQYGQGGQITGEAEISCSPPPPPDVSSTTVRVWRHDTARGKFYLLAEATSNKTALSWTMGATGKCTARIPYRMHTEVINDAFHGTWGHSDFNSPEVTLYC